ncbi:MAG TPA: DUF2752 domain-containing protein [Nitrospirota bacterium]
MRFSLKKRASGQIEFGIIYGGIALLALVTARFLPVLTLPSCAFKGLTGLPCPTCGSTRSVVHLAHGDILHSLAMNPLTALCFLGAVVYLLYSLITLMPGIPRLGIVLTAREKNAVRIVAIHLLLVNWFYLVFTR